MKKILLVVAASLACGGSLLAANLNVGELDLNFCGGGNKLTMNVDSNTTTGVCINLTNLSVKEGKITLGFVDGEMSQGSHVVQACKTSADGPFGKAINFTGENVFIIKPNETIQRTGTLTIPAGFVGSMYGCAVYTVLEDADAANDGKMFSVISRKANTITINVSGEVVSNLILEDAGAGLSNNPLISLVKNGDGGYTIGIKLHNNGTANELINAMVHIESDLGYKKDIQLINALTLLPGDGQDFSTQIGQLPWYGGNYTITVDVSNQASAANTPPKPTQTTSVNASYSFGLGEYGIIVILGGLFVILCLLFFFARHRKSRKAKKKEAKKEKEAMEEKKSKKAQEESNEEDVD